MEETILFLQVGEDVAIHRITLNRSRDLNAASTLVLRQTAQHARVKTTAELQKEVSQ